MTEELRNTKKRMENEEELLVCMYVDYLNSLCKENKRKYRYVLKHDKLIVRWYDKDNKIIDYYIIGTLNDIIHLFDIIKYEIDREEFQLRKEVNNETYVNGQKIRIHMY